MSDPPGEDTLRRELRAYYGPLLPVWDRTLAGRGDEPLWRWAAERWSGHPVLELGAGSGRITALLGERAEPLVAVDLNPEAVRAARERLAGRTGVHLVIADMRRLALRGRFSLVAAANDPFSHLRTDEGRDRALSRVAEHLAPDGRFLLDALWFTDDWIREAAGPDGKTVVDRPDRGPAADDDGAAGGRLVVRQSWRCRPDSHLCRAEYVCLRGDEEVARAAFRGRYWTRDELERRLTRAGLRIDALWGGYERETWSPGAEHLVVMAAPRRG